MVALAGIGIAYPSRMAQDELWRGFFSTHYAGVQRALASRLFSNSGVVSRHGAVNPLIEDVSGWSTEKRMRRYLIEALPLGKSAVADALAAAGVPAAEVAASMLEAAGTSATRRGNPLERLYRDARCGSLQPATSDVCADWLGIAALGGDPDADGSAPRW